MSSIISVINAPMTRILSFHLILMIMSQCQGFSALPRNDYHSRLQDVSSKTMLSMLNFNATVASASSSSSQLQQQCNSGYEYSRCLRTPKQEKEQINAEMVLQDLPKWRRPLSLSADYMLRKSRMLLSSAKKKIRGSSNESNDDIKPGSLILVRGGDSIFTTNYTFTGWADPPLTKVGVQQLEHAGRLLLESGYEPDIIYTSRLKRAIQSVWAISQEISAPYLPVYKSWRLNERHYGSLTGLSKKQTSKRFGAEAVQTWRTSLKARPPPAQPSDWYHPQNDRKYSDLLPEQIPVGESLLDCMERTRSLWELKIRSDLKMGNNVMVVAHAGALRGLAKIIDEIGDKEIADVSFPKGIPCVYKFDKHMRPIMPTDAASLTQAHSSGIFLEKPGLLKKAIDIQKQWERRVPGASVEDYDEMPSAAHHMSTIEESLLKLREEQEEFARQAHAIKNGSSSISEGNATVGTYVLNGNVILPNGSIGSEAMPRDVEERFEEDSENGNSSQKEVILNMYEGDVQKEPVVVLIRHGKTPHNKLALFTGWEDPPLADEGIEEAREGGRLLKKYGFEFDVVYCSWLYRAIQTAWYVLEEMDLLWLPLIKTWRLNERHYGALTGMSKKMVSNVHGEAQLKKWRKGYTVRPPPVSSYSFHYPGNDVRRTKYVEDLRISVTETIFRSIEQRKLVIHRKFPKCESLKDCMGRSIPFYTQKIVPEAVAKGKRVLIASHENAIRGILMHLCEIPEENMNDLHLPNGVPLIYNVRRKCISLLDDGSGENLLEKYDFGSAAQYLFRPCELLEEDLYVEEEESVQVESTQSVSL